MPNHDIALEYTAMLAREERLISANQEDEVREASSHASPETAGVTMSLPELAALLGVAIPAEPRFPDIVFPMRRVKAGEYLYRAGDAFDAVYAVRSGFFKTVCVDRSGAEQVLAFPMGGDVVGLEGLDPGRYPADVVALDDSHVAVVSFARLARLGREHPGLERLTYRIFSRELVREHGMIWLLGTLGAEARVAAFLLDLSVRFGRLGYSRASFVLRATRAEIGSYLGVKLETVSRALSGFAAAGLIEVDRRTVTLREPERLRRIIEPQGAGAESKRPGVAQSVVSTLSRAVGQRTAFAAAA
jgi:CRP/FNR family transcriptional regulator